MQHFILGTRGSALAMRQAQIVQTTLEKRVPGRAFAIQTVTAQADKNPELALTAMSGEGIFVKELEAALLEGRIDLAVHSLKDLPLDTPSGLRLSATLEREEPRDAFVSRFGATLDQLPPQARVGTSSLRRKSQLLHYRQDLQVAEIRGNVDTRLRKLDDGQYDAIIIAACGLIRLGLGARITEYLDIEWMLPEPGQGALAVETRADDADATAITGTLEDATTRACVEAERAFLRALGGGCRVPIAAYASITGATIELRGAVVAPDGSRQVRGRMSGPISDAIGLGERLANQLETQGARTLLLSIPSGG